MIVVSCWVCCVVGSICSVGWGTKPDSQPERSGSRFFGFAQPILAFAGGATLYLAQKSVAFITVGPRPGF